MKVLFNIQSTVVQVQAAVQLYGIVLALLNKTWKWAEGSLQIQKTFQHVTPYNIQL